MLDELDQDRAFFDAHPGAVYSHQGNTYIVQHLDLLRLTAHVKRARGCKYYTKCRDSTEVTVQHRFQVGGSFKSYLCTLAYSDDEMPLSTLVDIRICLFF